MPDAQTDQKIATLTPTHRLRAAAVTAEQFTGTPLTSVPAFDQYTDVGAIYGTDHDGVPWAAPMRGMRRMTVGDWIVYGDPTGDHHVTMSASIYSDAAFCAKFEASPNEAPHDVPHAPSDPPPLPHSDEMSPVPAESLNDRNEHTGVVTSDVADSLSSDPGETKATGGATPDADTTHAEQSAPATKATKPVKSAAKGKAHGQ